MKRTIHILTSMLLLSLLALSPACTRSDRSPTAGSEAPAFSLQDLNGTTVSLSDFRGKVVFLNFWGTWCHYCVEEAPSLARLNAAMAGKSFVMVTVSLDGKREDVEAFFRAAGLRLPTVMDPGGGVAKLYGVTGVPETFIIDGKGVIRKKFVGTSEWDGPEMITFLNGLTES